MTMLTRFRHALSRAWHRSAEPEATPLVALRNTDLPAVVADIEKLILEIAEKQGIDRSLCWRLMDRLLYCIYDAMAHLHNNRDVKVVYICGAGMATVGETLPASDLKTLRLNIEVQLHLLQFEIERGVPAEKLLKKQMQRKLRDVRIGNDEEREPELLEASLPIDINPLDAK
jgi:hypothetical protein